MSIAITGADDTRATAQPRRQSAAAARIIVAERLQET
jgi:hypothetical protein